MFFFQFFSNSPYGWMHHRIRIMKQKIIQILCPKSCLFICSSSETTVSARGLCRHWFRRHCQLRKFHRFIFFVASKIWSARSSSLYIFVSLSMHACCRRKKVANRLKVGRAPRKRVLDFHFPIVSVHVGVVSGHPVGHFFEIRCLSIDEGTNLGIGGWEEKPTCIGQSERGIGR